MDDTKIDLTEVGFRGMEWIVVAQYRNSWQALVNAVIELWVT